MPSNRDFLKLLLVVVGLNVLYLYMETSKGMPYQALRAETGNYNLLMSIISNIQFIIIKTW